MNKKKVSKKDEQPCKNWVFTIKKVNHIELKKITITRNKGDKGNKSNKENLLDLFEKISFNDEEYSKKMKDIIKKMEIKTIS